MEGRGEEGWQKGNIQGSLWPGIYMYHDMVIRGIIQVFHDFFSKWPMAYPVPNQKAERLVILLAEEVIPSCGVPEAVLSDRGANLLSHLMTDVCEMLGIHKLSTTSYHPQCDGMVEDSTAHCISMLGSSLSQKQ